MEITLNLLVYKYRVYTIDIEMTALKVENLSLIKFLNVYSIYS